MNIFGKYFDDNEKVLKSLTKVYGIGRATAHELSLTFGIGSNNKVKEVSKETWSRLIQAIELGPKKYNSAVKTKKASVGSVSVGNIGYATLEFSRVVGGSSKSFVHNKKLNQHLCENRAITVVRENIELAKKNKKLQGFKTFRRSTV